MKTRSMKFSRSRAGRLCTALFLLGCDAAVGVRRPAVEILDGNGQAAPPGTTLGQSISLVIRDGSRRPLGGHVVTWTARDGGSASPDRSVTDESGVATTFWTLGNSEGVQYLSALTDAGEVVFEAVAKPDSPGIAVLSLETFDGSGQTVHPDVAIAEMGAIRTGYLAVTPYPRGNASYENPSLFASRGSRLWSIPAGVTNPVAIPASGEYLSDPDVVVTDRGELWVYYRAVSDRNIVRLTRSVDRVHFSAPIEVASAPNHNLVSPTVVQRAADDWLMWSVKSNAGCSAATTSVELRRSPDGIHWSAPQTVSMNQPGYFPWHLEVQWIATRQEFWALFNGKVAGSCTTPALFLAMSADGIIWKTFPSPILERGAIPEFEDIVYRSTFLYDPTADAIDLWYSGARYDGRDYIWRSAHQRRMRDDLFGAATRERATALRAQRLVPELRDPP